MISVYNLLPENYYNNSRDFQFIGRIFEAALNYSKSASDTFTNNFIYNKQLLDLLASTIGFISKHEYNNNDLLAVLSSFNKLLKNKGTKQAIEDCCRVLLRAQNIKQEPNIVIENVSADKKNSYIVTIYLSAYVTDIILLEDLLDYILPAGYLYEIIIGKKDDKVNSTNFVFEDSSSSEQESTKITGGVAKWGSESKSTISIVVPGNFGDNN